jgi:hypothetical protein
MSTHTIANLSKIGARTNCPFFYEKNQQLVVSKENLLILSPLGSIFEKVLPSNLFSAWISGTYHVDSKVFSTLKMCSVLEQGGMEWNGSVLRS